VQLLQDGHDLLAALAVQRTSRFIGQDHRPTFISARAMLDALLLAAGELVGMVLQARAQSEFPQQILACASRCVFGMPRYTAGTSAFSTHSDRTSGCNAGK